MGEFRSAITAASMLVRVSLIVLLHFGFFWLTIGTYYFRISFSSSNFVVMSHGTHVANYQSDTI